MSHGSAYLIDWLSLLGRWVHLITGIAWIGASFYFVWLDNHLLAPARKRREQMPVSAASCGPCTAAASITRRSIASRRRQLPGTLHWFYWEAYSTWLSGFFLLCLLYYARAEIYLIDPAVAALSKPQAIAHWPRHSSSASWLIYDVLCRSPLGRNDRALGIVARGAAGASKPGRCVTCSAAAAPSFSSVRRSARSWWRTCSSSSFPGSANWYARSRRIASRIRFTGMRGKQRSVHNTYFTLPVLFTMISNHYAMTYGARYNWLVLIGMCIAGALIRAWFVARHKAHERGGRTSPYRRRSVC